MKSIEKSARTYDEALEAALQELDATIADVDILVLEEGSKGLFGFFGSRPTRIRVTLKQDETEAIDLARLLGTERKPAPVQAAEVPASVVKEEPVAAEPIKTKDAPSVSELQQKETDADEQIIPVKEDTPDKKQRAPRQRKPRSERPKHDAEATEHPAPAKKPLPPKEPVKLIQKPVITMLAPDAITADSAAGKAKAFLADLTRMMGVEVEISVGTDADGNIFVQMTGDTLGVLIGRRGETLDALQYLTSLKVNRGQEGYTRVTLDTENYRAKREDTLIRLANRMANRAVKTGRKVSLEPMNPYERRIIHSALQANDAVDTHSEGEEPNRHVVITLRKA